MDDGRLTGSDPTELHELRRELERLRRRVAELESESVGGSGVHSELHASREMSRLVMDNIPQGVFWKDLDSVYLGCNRSFAAAVGLASPSAIVGKTDFELPWRARAELYRQADQEVITSDQALVREGENTRADGSEGWLRTTKVPMHDDKGQVIGVLGVDEDITHQRRLDDALRSIVEASFSSSGEDFFGSLVRHLATALGVRYAFIAEDVGGAGEMSRTLAMWDRDHLRESVEYSLEGTPCGVALASGPAFFPDDLRRRFPGVGVLEQLGAESYLGAPLYDSSGQTIGLLSVMDTERMVDSEAMRSVLRVFSARAGAELERKRADEALRRSRERYRGLFEDSPTSLWELDCSAVRGRLEALRQDGVEDFEAFFCEHPEELERFAALVQVVEVNRATLRLIKAQDKEQLRRSLMSIFTRESSATFRQALIALARRRQSFETETVSRTFDGRRLEMHLKWFLAPGSEDTLDRVVIALTDITERKRIERQLRDARDQLERRVEERTSELAAAHQELKSLLSIVTHDLRGPLVSLKGFAGELAASCGELDAVLEPVRPQLGEGAARELGLALDEDIPEALRFIDASVSRLDHFVGTLRRLSHEGRRELNMEWVDVEAVAREALSGLGYQLEQRRAQVVIGALPPAWADRVCMEQILGNLLANAALYLDPERVGRIEVHGEAGNGEIVYRVSDNGLGIHPEDRSKIFQPFRRGRHKEIDGEGMGLAFVQALVRRQQGRIWCESEVDEGTTFSFSVPEPAEAAEAPETADSVEPAEAVAPVEVAGAGSSVR